MSSWTESQFVVLATGTQFEYQHVLSPTTASETYRLITYGVQYFKHLCFVNLMSFAERE